MPRGGRRRTTWTKKTRPKGGRTKGSRDRVPRKWKGSLRQMFEDYGQAHPDRIWTAIDRGVKGSKAHLYLSLMAESLETAEKAKTIEEFRSKLTEFLALMMKVVTDHGIPRDAIAPAILEGARRWIGIRPEKVIDVAPEPRRRDG